MQFRRAAATPTARFSHHDDIADGIGRHHADRRIQAVPAAVDDQLPVPAGPIQPAATAGRAVTVSAGRKAVAVEHRRQPVRLSAAVVADDAVRFTVAGRSFVAVFIVDGADGQPGDGHSSTAAGQSVAVAGEGGVVNILCFLGVCVSDSRLVGLWWVYT